MKRVGLSPIIHVFFITFLFALGALEIRAQFADGFESPPAPIWECPTTPQLIEERKTWTQVFGPGFVYPSTPGDFYPVGSWTLAGRKYHPQIDLTGSYITIPFIAADSPQQLQWNSAKPVYGYQPARFAEAVYVTVTACPGDFRLAGSFQYVSPDPVNDPSFVTQCRSTNTSEAVMSYGPREYGTLFCPVTPGQIHYINIVFQSALDGLQPEDSGCALPLDPNRPFTGACEISVKNRPTL